MPARKRSNGPIVAVVLLAVVVVGLGVVGAVASNNRSHRVADSGYNNNYPTYSSTSDTDTTDTTDNTTTAANRTTGRSTTGGRSTGNRTSDTATPPSTQSGPKAVIALGDNPFNTNLAAMQATCTLPPFNNSAAGQDTYYRAALPCLENAWAPVLASVNLPYTPVKLQTITEDVSTPCGTRSATRETAMYCEGVIYMTAPYYSDNEQLGNAGGKYLGVLAHEFGHHLQQLSGILSASGQAAYNAGGWDTNGGLEVSRRRELQASCFAAMFIAAVQNKGSVNGTIAQQAIDDESQRGDWPQYPRRDHGTPDLNNAWVHQGYRTNSTQQCNTWLADSAHVA
ncbi:hypothetical protein F0L68_09085 [Solihabitans fulvus]|uniref:Neutral zinc metallopeptidase n=2 Tax=Solihabitans fulvus TaxID=1892852 RepID=A0A5B2XL71_9PSEU|nr:hypothetical protein F0L68_09085 [Solihabitans fulvus]